MTDTRWFEVDQNGLKNQNAGREPWELIRELVQNAWDEAPFASECRITTRLSEDRKNTEITVEDNGDGFADIKDAYTLMGSTPKRDDPKKRGRFNRGEKDVISAAREATIETVGTTVKFLPDGTRKQEENERARGTLVKLIMPWNEDERAGLVTQLRTLRPPIECKTEIDGDPLTANPPVISTRAQVETVIQDEDGILKSKRMSAIIHITEPHDTSGKRRIYEMGIPIQEIECPWDADIPIKVPLNESRDQVKPAYLNKIYSVVLDAAHHMMKDEEFSKSWVKHAIEQNGISREAVRATMKGRYGAEKAVFAVLDQDACQRAQRAEYAVVNKGGLSDREVKAFKQHCDMEDADVKFPTPPPPQEDYEAEPGTPAAEFAEWVKRTAEGCGVYATVRFFNEPNNKREADCQVATTMPTLRFNEGLLGPEFLSGPYGEEHYNLLLHELGHALAEGSSGGHDELWGEGVSKAGALLATKSS